MTGVTRVIKVGGRAQEDPALAAALARVWRAVPRALCVVHGGGDAISALQRRLGSEPEFLNGRRVTTRAEIALVRMALSGAANKELVARILSAGAPALGVSGEDAALLTARPLADGALGRAGALVEINVRVLHHLLEGGLLPVISPLARDCTTSAGEALNVNADDAAGAIAAALAAEELLLVADVPGVLVDGMPCPTLDIDEALALGGRGVATGGMIAKLEAAATALAGGVERVRIGDVSAIGESRRGTVLTLSRSGV